MKYKFHVDRKSAEIDIANNATFHSPTEIVVEGTKLEVAIGEFNDKEVFSFFVNNRLHQVEMVWDEEGYPRGIFVNGEFYSASLIKIDKLFYYKEKPVNAAKSKTVKSFIPGYVKKIYFSEGDAINEGDIVLIHEAMKMENEIRAPRSGRLARLGVKEGENILANHLLFEIE